MISIPPDKWAHFGIGAIVGLSGLWLGAWALVPILIAAIGKELWDYRHPPHSADIWDAIATSIGGLLSLALIAMKAAYP